MLGPRRRASRRRLFAVLIFLYGGQFLAGGLIAALPAVLRQNGASLTQVGTISLVTLMTLAKLLWAPLVDRYGHRGRGHYRSWLLVLQPAIVFVLVAMAPLDPRADFLLLLLMACLLSGLIATQDIATDALAVLLIPREDRGIANAIQVGAGFAGAVVGTSGTLLIYQHWGWAAATCGLAALSLLPLLTLRLLDEPGTAHPRTPPNGPAAAALIGLLRQPRALWWMGAIVPLTWGGIMLSHSLLAPLLIDRGWRLDQLSLLTSVAAGAAGILGALGGGWLARRCTRRHVLLAAGAGQFAATAFLYPVTIGNAGAAAVAATLCLGAARGVTNTIIFTVSMDLCRTESAGGDFALLSGWGYGVAILSGALGPLLADVWDYRTALFVALALSTASLACVYAKFRTLDTRVA